MVLMFGVKCDVFGVCRMCVRKGGWEEAWLKEQLLHLVSY